MKTSPVPVKNVSLAQLARGINQLHVCLDDQKKQTGALVELATELQTDIRGFKALPRKALLYVVGAAVSAWIGLLAQNFILHEETGRKADQAAATATQAASVARDTDAKVAAVAKAVGATP